MITESIKDYVFSLNNLEDCTELTINKLGIDGNILAVDLNDLNNFPNLESLSLCNMTIGEKDFLILESLVNLKTLKLYNCDFSNENLISFFNNLSIENLLLDSTEVNFSKIKKYFNKIVLKNVENIHGVECESLDISKAKLVDFNKLNIENYINLTVSKTQYMENKEILKSYNNNLTIMNDFYDEVGDIDEKN